jgi:hypothetical protein
MKNTMIEAKKENDPEAEAAVEVEATVDIEPSLRQQETKGRRRSVNGQMHHLNLADFQMLLLELKEIQITSQQITQI